MKEYSPGPHLQHISAKSAARWDNVARATALTMAVAAEPSWLAGNAAALIGSIVLISIALGARPKAVLRILRRRRRR